MLHKLTLSSLLVHLASSAATQTVYGAGFSLLRWVSLFALAGFGFVTWAMSRRLRVRMDGVNLRVAIYLGSWGLTVIASDYPLFSSYRLAAHALIVVSGLVLLPAVLRLKDVRILLPALKIAVAVILLVSYFHPDQLNSFDDPNLARGIMGNSNALGHAAAIGCLLFLHGFITQKGTRWGSAQAALAGLAVILLIRSGTRSSVVAFIGGFLPMLVLYRVRLSRYLMIGAVGVVIALMTLPFLSDRISEFLLKQSNPEMQDADITLDRVAASRLSLWQHEWEGFLERPLLGWGFGLDSEANPSDWTGELTALGVTTIDPTNDALYTMEEGGIVGLSAYFLMVSLVLNIWIPKAARSVLDAELRRPGYELAAAAYEAQKAFYCLAMLLIVMFEFDGTALAAGNFFAAVLWISLGLSAGLRASLIYGMRSLAGHPHPAKPCSHFPAR